MTARVGIFHPQGINQYVPAMQFTNDPVTKGIAEIDLSTLFPYDQDGIDNDADGDPVADFTVWAADMDGAAGTETDAKYGQTVVLKVSGDPGAGGIDVKVIGEDYLGQPMLETIVCANGSSAEVEGLKAFKRIIKHVVSNPATNAITFDLGWGNKFGLPYKIAQYIGGKEDGKEVSPSQKAQRTVTGVDAGAGTTAGSVTAPFDGYIMGNSYEVTTAQASSAATIDAVVAGSGQATLDLVVPVMSIGDGADNMLAKSAWIAVNQGDTITYTSDGGGDTGVIAVTTYFTTGEGDVTEAVTTDPQTATTGDPRGLYDPQSAPDGTKTYTFRGIFDSSVNAAGNGGFHGIRHYIA